jgi:hypothetical protein
MKLVILVRARRGWGKVLPGDVLAIRLHTSLPGKGWVVAHAVILA